MSDVVESQEQDQEMIEVLVEGVDQIPEEQPPAEEVVEEEVEFKGLDRDALIKRIRESESKAQQSISASTQAFSGAVERLGQTLAQGQQQSVAPQPVPAPMSREQVREKLEREIAEKPAEALEVWAQQTFGPVIQTLTSNNLAALRGLTRLQKGAEAFDKYATKIDQWVRTRPTYEQMQPDIYEKAYSAVMMENIEAVVEERAQEIVRKRAESAPTAPPRPALYTERGGSAAPRPATAKVRTVVLTAAERADADARGLDYPTYAKLYKGVSW